MTISFTFASSKRKFEEALSMSPNPKLLIQREIDEVLEYVNTIPNLRELRRRNKQVLEHQSNSVFSIEITPLSRGLFSLAFNENLSVTGKMGIGKVDSESDEVFEHRQKIVKLGNEFFKYYEWLNEQLVKKQTVGRGGKLTLNQKVLALNYLGVDIVRNDKTKTAKMLAAVLGMDEQNIRECLTYINIEKNEVRTRRNLESLQQLFENNDFFKVAAEVQKDIEKLS